MRRGEFFTRADRSLEPALGRRIGAVVRRVEQTERMERTIEVEIVEACRRAIELEIPSALVGLDAVGDIAERYEQAVHVLLIRLDERAERQRLAFQRERQRTDAAH